MSKNYKNLYIENAVLGKTNDQKLKLLSDNEDCCVQYKYIEENRYHLISLKKNVIFDEPYQIRISEVLRNIIKKELAFSKIKKSDNILVVGIGNENLTADALGGYVAKSIEVTEHFFSADCLPKNKGRLSSIAPNVSGNTGIQSIDIIQGVVKETSPAYIIAVDTLATKFTPRLSKVIEVSTNGIVPGSGVANAKKEISAATLGIPVLAIGVPLVIYAKHIVEEYVMAANNIFIKKALSSEIHDLVVTSKEIEMYVQSFGQIISGGINGAVHKNR